MDQRGYSYLLLLIAACCGLTSEQCDATNCSARCIPERWKRQLCLFYAELEDWRDTAQQCGLSVEEFTRDQSRSAVDQWQEARTNWNTIHELWREFAADNGVAIATDDISGSGLLDVMGDSVDIGEGDLEEAWRGESEEWAEDLRAWQEYASTSMSQGAEPTGDPNDLWMENLSDWSNSYVVYNTTYYHTCPAV